MPTDHTLAPPENALSGRLTLPVLLWIASGICILTALLPLPVGFRFGCLTVGGMLLVLGLAISVKNQLRKRDDQASFSAALSLSEKDPDPTFLVDQDDMIRFMNAAATRRFGDFVNQPTERLLCTILAKPETVIQRLREQLETSVNAKENVPSRTSTFRVAAFKASDTIHLWRVDDLGELSKGSTSTSASGVLPRLTIRHDGTVLSVNEPGKAMLGVVPRVLSDAVLDLPLRSGQVHRLKTTNGRANAMAVQVDTGDENFDVYLLPESAAGMPRIVQAGWDAIEDLPVPLMKISPDGEVLASNREARLLLRVSDTTGRRVADLLDGLGRPINDWLREAAEGRGGQVSQFLRGRSENQDTFVQVTLNLSGENADMHLIAVLNDVTELKTLEAQFVQSQKMQAIGQLAGGVAHDFNNLLTAISGHCDLLLLRHNEGDQNYGDLIQIHQNANRAASLVGQLLAYSRKQNLQPEIVDLRDTLSDLTHLLNRLVGEKVVLSLNHDPALAQIKADKRQLEQVLMNLVVNARDAMPSGGEIKVSTENLVLNAQMVQDRAVVPPGEYVVVKVTDEGHGIPPEKLPKIFEPFYTTKRPGEGTGLGLSTAYGIVKQTGGFIFAESTVGKGTQFTLLFPSYDLPVAEPLELPTAGPEPISSQAEGVVLLVEDEAPVRAFASRALRLRGYTVLEADCAEAALEMLADESLAVDIFVTDVIMPGIDGPTWVREALQTRPDTKVVFVSGYAEDAFGDDQSRIPNSVFLPKPFSLNALTQTVQTQLQD